MAHVFISYVHENQEEADRLCDELTERGINVWLDRNDISPGVRWRQAVRRAIRDGAFFIACFSKEYSERGESYMNEELVLAIDTLRGMPAERAWFISVKLNECEVPDRDIGAGETLRDLQYIELYKDWYNGIQRIVSVIAPGHPGVQLSTSDGQIKSTIGQFKVAFTKAGFGNTLNLARQIDLKIINLLKRTAAAYAQLLSEDLSVYERDAEELDIDKFTFYCFMMLAQGYMLDRFLTTGSLMSEALPDNIPGYEELAERWSRDVLTNPEWMDNWLDDFTYGLVEEYADGAIREEIGEIPDDRKDLLHFLKFMKTCMLQGLVARRYIMSKMKA